MRKISRAILLSYSLLFSCACLIGGQNGEAETSTDQATSGFDMLAQGNPMFIGRDEGKDALKNYREKFRIDVSGVDETGKSASGFLAYVVEMDKPADLRREISTMETPGGALSGVDEYVVSSGVIYHVGDAIKGGRLCTREEVSAETQAHISDYVVRPLLTITPGKLLEKGVRVNNVAADVYEIRDIGLLIFRSISKIDARVWVAQKPPFLLKAEGTVEGEVEWENEIYTGKAELTYEVKDLEQVKIELPALCAHPPEEMIPVPENATEVRTNPPMIYFNSADTAERVKDFYLNELAEQGWDAVEVSSDTAEKRLEANITRADGVKIAVQIQITAMGAGGSSVSIAWQAE